MVELLLLAAALSADNFAVSIGYGSSNTRISPGMTALLNLFCLLGADVARQPHAVFSVLDGGARAAADTGHAVGAVLPPNGLPGLQGDVVEGASPDALPAAGAGVSSGEGVCFHEAGIEDGIHRPAHEAVIELPPGRGKGPVFPDGGDRAVYVRLRSGHDLPGFLHLRGVEHGNVVLRHDDLRRAHAGKIFFLTETAVVPVGIADLAAAGHDEPRPLRSGQLRQLT
mgnify:CR=1 FL=1